MSYWTQASHHGGTALLRDLNFGVPVAQVFPQTPAALSALGVGSGLASALYDFEESSSPVLDHSGNGYDLAAQGSPLFTRKGLGIYSSGALDSKTCVEMRNGEVDALAAASSGILDFGTNSWAVLVVFRCGGTNLAANTVIVGKLQSFDGWSLRLESSGGSLVVRQRVNPLLDIALVSGQWNDGAINCALVVMDRVADEIGIFSNRGSNTSPGLTVPDISNSSLFSFGRQPSLGFYPPQLQMLYSAVWVGSAAEGMGQTDFDAFWRHATDPTGELTTIQHASTIFDRASDSQVAAWVSDELPIAYHPNLTNTNKMGLRGTRPISNLLSESDDFTTAWVASGVTVSGATADKADSPREMRDSQKLTATAPNDYIGHQFTTVAADPYTIGCYVTRHPTMAGDVTGRVIFYDVSNGAELAAQAFTAGTAPQRVTLSAVTNAGQVSSAFRVEIDTGGEAITAAFATAVAGYEWLPIFTEGGTATIALTRYEAAGAVNRYMRAVTGEIEFTGVQDAADHNIAAEYLDVHSDGATDNNKHELLTDDLQRYTARIYDAAGSEETTLRSFPIDLSQERTVVRQWDAASPIESGKYARLFVDNAEHGWYSGGPWSAASLNDELSLLSDAGANGFTGLMSRYRTWKKPVSDDTRALLLCDLDFSEPPIHPRPANNTELTALGLPAADHIHLFDEASGNMLDRVGSADLIESGSPALLRRQTALGLWDGSAIDNHVCMESQEGGTTELQPATVAEYDVATESFVILFLVKFPAQRPPVIRYLFRKGYGGGQGGYHLYNGLAGGIQCAFGDGTTFVGSNINQAFFSGGWHLLGIRLHRGTEIFSAMFEEGFGAQNSAAGIGSGTTTQPFRMLIWPPVVWDRSPAVQIAWMGFWRGSNAEELIENWSDTEYREQLFPIGIQRSNWDRPQYYLDSYTWAPVKSNRLRGYPYWAVQLGWDANLPTPHKFGLQTRQTISTLLTESDRYTEAIWTKTNVTVSALVTWADLDPSPLDLRVSHKITATADNGYLEHLFATTPGSEYSIYGLAKRHSSMATDVTGRIVAYDNIAAAEISSVAFTATSDWQGKDDGISHTFTAPAGCTQVGFRVEIDTNGESICFAFATAVAGKPELYIPTSAGTTTVLRTTFSQGTTTTPIGTYMRALTGEEQVTFIANRSTLENAENFITDAHQSAGFVNARKIYGLADETLKADIHDGVFPYPIVKTLDAGVYDWSQARSVILQWSAASPDCGGGYYARLVVDGVEKDTHNAPWTSSETTRAIYLGCELNTSPYKNHFNGLISSVRVYNKPVTP